MKRLLLVYNPRSSHFWKVDRDVITKARSLRGFMVGKYEIKDTDVDDNAEKLSRLIMDGDIVVAAGGDGTATIAMNGVMLAAKDNVRLGVMGYGNFNDFASACGNLGFDEIMATEAKEAWPLECRVDEKHWRYAMCYFTAGMFAESCAVFDKPKVRKKMQKKHARKGFCGSICSLAGWWFRNKKKCFLPESFELIGSAEEGVECKGCSDYLAINNKRIAKVMKGGNFLDKKDAFLSHTGNMRGVFALFCFMVRSMFKEVPGFESEYDMLSFNEPADVMLQGEGEYKKFEQIRKIEIKKAERPVLLIQK